MIWLFAFRHGPVVLGLCLLAVAGLGIWSAAEKARLGAYDAWRDLRDYLREQAMIEVRKMPRGPEKDEAICRAYDILPRETNPWLSKEERELSKTERERLARHIRFREE